VWLDTDGDGVQDADEPGIAGVTVTLVTGSTALATTTTDADGKYLFTDLPAGEYQVIFTLPDLPNIEGEAFTTYHSGPIDLDSDADVTGVGPPFTLGPGQVDLTWDAGVIYVSILDVSLTTTTTTSSGAITSPTTTAAQATTLPGSAVAQTTLPETGFSTDEAGRLAGYLLGLGLLLVLVGRSARREET